MQRKQKSNLIVDNALLGIKSQSSKNNLKKLQTGCCTPENPCAEVLGQR